MNEALSSILTSEKVWHYNSKGQYIQFDANGTGELWCRSNFSFWIAADLEWKPTGTFNSAKPSNKNVKSPVSNRHKQPHVLGDLKMEMTLLKRLPEREETHILERSTMINEKGLTDDAFQPKTYTVRIEQGNFKEPCYIGSPDANDRRYALRLIFDKSPYPPRDEWLHPEKGADGGEFWDLTEFVARKSPELAKQGVPMNEPLSRWGICAVS